MAQIFGAQGQLTALLEAVTEALTSAENSLERLNTFPMDNEAIDQSYHHMHIIGRAASMMEWPQLAEVAHGTEGILRDVLDGLTRIDPPKLTHLQNSMHTIQRLLLCLQSPDRLTTWPPTLDGTGRVVTALQAPRGHEESEQEVDSEFHTSSFKDQDKAVLR